MLGLPIGYREPAPSENTAVCSCCNKKLKTAQREMIRLYAYQGENMWFDKSSSVKWNASFYNRYIADCNEYALYETKNGKFILHYPSAGTSGGRYEEVNHDRALRFFHDNGIKNPSVLLMKSEKLREL